MPLCLLFLMAGMLSLCSGLFLFYQEKRKSPSVANRGKPVLRAKNLLTQLKRFLPACTGRRYGRNDGFIDGTNTILEAILYTLLSASCYPASQIFAGKSTEIFALPPHNLTAQGRIKASAVGQSQG
ncbi:hypothetical protein SAMN05421827_1029 [Pedobacter terrae]|uniref:Uncharacterized protein n=1 Tax=Pedobacter terrae TaxID=405671 RepID=A0A1G7PTM1_9SPHI|nr:hypothetical protein [Pedobacter terrae]SDF88740.1 hypothetical protein SAMN05421827_1029 [Pedobacter terrae]